MSPSECAGPPEPRKNRAPLTKRAGLGAARGRTPPFLLRGGEQDLLCQPPLRDRVAATAKTFQRRAATAPALDVATGQQPP